MVVMMEKRKTVETSSFRLCIMDAHALAKGAPIGDEGCSVLYPRPHVSDRHLR